ncbi:MAG: flavin reductase family protein [Gammaproteobacteria bacterium]|nr:flavin reductase family protein [Gammaproteobacteria bacterium]
MFYDSEARLSGDSPGLPFNPFKALVAPRPIGWITTIAPDRTVNLAPYSHFQAVADNPDIVMFSATPNLKVEDGQVGFTEARKHSEQNAIASGEFVCNIVSHDLGEEMNLTSAHLPADVSEVGHAGLEMLPSERVEPPRVARAPAALECVVVDTHVVQRRGGDHIYRMVFGEVVGIHIQDRYITDGLVQTSAMKILTRMGYDEYAVLEESFNMSRPDFDPILDGMLKS